MELVYLWVENYKNIHKQGFNFSPRFECEYVDGSLSICDKQAKDNKCKNKDYIEDFFGENINVTAIVGENGSGKSSVSKLILMLIYYYNFKDLLIDNKSSREDKINYENKNLIEKNFKDKIFLVIIDDNDKRKTINIGDAIPKNILKLEKITFFSTYFNYMLDTLWDSFDDDWVNQIYHKSDDYDTPLLIQPNKHDKQSYNDTIDLYILEYLTKQKILQFYHDVDNDVSINNFFKPNYMQLINRYMHPFRLDHTTPEYIELSIMKKISQKIESVVLLNEWEFQKKSEVIGKELKQIEDNKDYEYMNLLYIAFKVLDSKKSYFKKSLYLKLESEIKEFIKADKLPPKEYLNSFEFAKIIISDSTNYNVLKLKISLDFHNKKIYKDKIFQNLFDNELYEITALKNILIYIPAWIDIEFFHNKKSFESLSSGEKTLLRLILDVMYQFNNAVKEYDTVNFLLDETELGLHPNWQKRYLSDLLKSIKPLLEKYENKKINIVFTTHSPFILSDLPKENVIFLDTFNDDKDMNKEITKKKYPKVDIKNLENGNCINVSDYVGINPFGANIHTLLSDGFFMSGGLMGEFAKGKINEIVHFYNAVKKDKKSSEDYEKVKNEFYYIQKNIGEEYLQEVIKNHIEFIEKQLGNESFKNKEKEELLEKLKALGYSNQELITELKSNDD